MTTKKNIQLMTEEEIEQEFVSRAGFKPPRFFLKGIMAGQQMLHSGEMPGWPSTGESAIAALTVGTDEAFKAVDMGPCSCVTRGVIGEVSDENLADALEAIERLGQVMRWEIEQQKL